MAEARCTPSLSWWASPPCPARVSQRPSSLGASNPGLTSYSSFTPAGGTDSSRFPHSRGNSAASHPPLLSYLWISLKVHWQPRPLALRAKLGPLPHTVFLWIPAWLGSQAGAPGRNQIPSPARSPASSVAESLAELVPPGALFLCSTSLQLATPS